MKVARLLEQRRQNWIELHKLTTRMQGLRTRRLQAAEVMRFAALYRAACADLALADAYQLPPSTVQYLDRLVADAYNQLYRARPFNVAVWLQTLLFEVPQRIFQDRCVQFAFCLFWGTFILSALLALGKTAWPNYAQQLLGTPMIQQLEESFKNPLGQRDADANMQMAGFYIRHNTSIGLTCFAGGLLVVPGILITVFNAAHLGAAFGYMARSDVPAGANFFEFVTAHGPFELTAIVLSAGAGLRLGMSLLRTDGLTRLASLERTARHSMPLMGAAMILFFLAALIEGFLSPTAAPYLLKATVAVLSSGMIMFYFVILGFPRRPL